MNNLNLFNKNKLSRNYRSEIFGISSYTDNFSGTNSNNENKNVSNRRNNNYSLSSNSTKNIKITNWDWNIKTNNSNRNFNLYNSSNKASKISLQILKIKEEKEKLEQVKNNIIDVDGLNLIDRIKKSNIERLFSPHNLVNKKYHNINDDRKNVENKFYGTDKFYLPLYILCSPRKKRNYHN